MDAKLFEAGSQSHIAPESYPTLRALGLRESELEILKHQGYLSCDRRHRSDGAGYWRLRFREDGQNRAIYVGQDLAFVEEVKDELMQLRAARRGWRELEHMMRHARRALRQ